MSDISRTLTSGETELLRTVFGSGINYSSVRIKNYKWIPLQPNDTAITPNGNMYWPPAHYLDDFSATSVPLGIRGWFVHEGAHLYQYYGLRWNVKARWIVSHKYNYKLDPSKPKLSDYGCEQMGDIAEDYYVLKEGGAILRPYGLTNYAGLLPIP